MSAKSQVSASSDKAAKSRPSASTQIRRHFHAEVYSTWSRDVQNIVAIEERLGVYKMTLSVGDQGGTSSHYKIFANIFISFIGAGILGLPFAFKEVHHCTTMYCGYNKHRVSYRAAMRRAPIQ